MNAFAPHGRAKVATRIFMLLSFALGFAGYALLRPFWEAANPTEGLLVFLDTTYQAARLFFMEGPPVTADSAPGAHLVLISIARILAPLSLVGFLFTLSDRLWQPIENMVRLSLLRDHVVLLGFDAESRLIAGDIRRAGHTVLFIARDPAETQHIRHQHPGAIVIEAGDDTSRLWRKVRLRKAQRVLFFRDDFENLQLLEQIRDLQDAEATPLRPISVFMRVRSLPLKRELTARAGVFAPCGQFRIEPFNLDELFARDFFHQRDMFLSAQTAGKSGLHWLVFGWNARLGALVEQMVKVSPFPGFPAPRVTVYTAADMAVRADLDSRFGGLKSHVDYEVRPWPAVSTLPAADELRALDESRAITATFFAGAGSGEIEAALALAGAGMRGRLFDAHCYLCLGPEDGAGVPSIASEGLTLLPHAAGRLYRKLLAGEPDLTAMAFHKAYSTYAKSSEPWDSLDENMRNANRRAADHVKTKLEALGFAGPIDQLPDSTEPVAAKIGAMREALARAEHESWSIDRILNGWRAGATRDNERRIHPNLVPYDDLSDYEKDLDRWQVDQLPEIVTLRSQWRQKDGEQRD